MHVELRAQVTKVQGKPPKIASDGLATSGPRLQIVLEVEGVDQIGTVARFLGQVAHVELHSLQRSFDDLPRDNRSVAERVVDELDGTVIGDNSMTATLTRKPRVAQTG